MRAARAASRGSSRDLARLAREVSDDRRIGSRVSLGNIGLDGLVERQSFDLVGTQSVAVAGPGVIRYPTHVPDGAEVEDGVEAGVDVVDSRLHGSGVAVVGGLPGPIHCFPEGDVNGALPAEVALASQGRGRH